MLKLICRVALVLYMASLGQCLPLQKKPGGGMEEFEEQDPYTKGERALEKQLGYVALGSFAWAGSVRTAAVQEAIGGVPMLWLETEHFKIGSSLGTYRISPDRREREILKAEWAQLKQKLGRFKAPRQRIDPWLRLHLYAQRLENLYARFEREFGLEASDFGDKGPYLGQPKKHNVLLCQRKSEFVRYLGAYFEVQEEYSYRATQVTGGSFFGVNYEAVRTSWDQDEEMAFDTMLHCTLVEGVARNFIEGFNQNSYTAPPWLAPAVGYRYQRDVDPRWSYVPGAARSQERKQYEWEPRVRNLVKNDFFISTQQMFAWTQADQMNVRDCLVTWSKLQFLLEELDGDRAGFLVDVCVRPPQDMPDASTELSVRQTEALTEHFKRTPEELDEAWAKWVKKAYR